MSDTGKTIALIKAVAGKIDPSTIEQSVSDWLDDHPEATTTVEDGSITKAKLHSDLQDTVDDVSQLKNELNAAQASKTSDSFNLFDKTSPFIDYGHYLNSSGNISSGENYAISHYIEVEPSTSYVGDGITSSSTVYLAEYDEDFNLIQTAAGNSFNNAAYTTSATTKYIRLSIQKNVIHRTKIHKGTELIGYFVGSNNIDDYRFDNKKLSANAFYTGIKTKGIQFIPIETYTNTGVTSLKLVDTSSSNWSMSQIFGIPTSAKTISIYNFYQSQYRASIVFLKDNSLTSANVVNAYGFTDSSAETETTYTIPSGAKYFSVAMRQSNATDNSVFSVYCAEFDPASFKTEVEGIASEIVAPFDGRIDALEDFTSETATYVVDKSKNRLVTSTVTRNKIAWKNGNIQDNDSYSYTDYIAISPGDTISVYHKVESAWVKKLPRCVCAYDANKSVLSSEGSDSVQTDFTAGANTYFVRLTCTTSHITGEESMIFINDTNVPTIYYPYYETTEEYEAKESFVKNSLGPILAKNKYSVMVQAAEMEDGDTIKACENIDNKKNDIISFYAEIDTFDTLLIGHGYNMTYGSYIVIDGTNLTTYYGTSQYYQHAHGLTFSHYISAEIKHNNSGRADITISTDGGEYTVSASSVAWDGCKGDVFATSDGSTLNNVTLSCTFNDLQENVFIFGDSYVGIVDSARWPKYLISAGYTKNAIFGFGGAKSAEQKKVFDNVLQMAKPNYVVWLLGMNDGDTSSAINATYKEVLDSVIAVCLKNKITPILATIPNTPTANHTYKNAYVKSLGYRYVDFAAAVGATEAESTWWSGMLAQDNTHPTALGAKALYARFVAEVPEALKT